MKRTRNACAIRLCFCRYSSYMYIYIYIYKEVFTYCFTYRGGSGLVSRSVIQSFIAFGSTRYE